MTTQRSLLVGITGIVLSRHCLRSERVSRAIRTGLAWGAQQAGHLCSLLPEDDRRASGPSWDGRLDDCGCGRVPERGGERREWSCFIAVHGDLSCRSSEARRWGRVDHSGQQRPGCGRCLSTRRSFRDADRLDSDCDPGRKQRIERTASSRRRIRRVRCLTGRCLAQLPRRHIQVSPLATRSSQTNCPPLTRSQY